jgi:hypothetical protein
VNQCSRNSRRLFFDPGGIVACFRGWWGLGGYTRGPSAFLKAGWDPFRVRNNRICTGGIAKNAQPPATSCNPSGILTSIRTTASRRPTQDSRSGWSRCSFPVGLLHLQHAGLSRRTDTFFSKLSDGLASMSRAITAMQWYSVSMQVTLTIPDELAAEAGARGFSVQAYAEDILRRAAVPVEDEVIGLEEERAVAEARAWRRRNHPISNEEVLAEFGLTPDDFDRLGQTPLPQQPNGSR